MKERPIIFSSPMVRAILDGKKTQTRRPVKPQPPMQPTPARSITSNEIYWVYPDEVQPRSFGTIEYPDGSICTGVERVKSLKCPYGQRGDRLWVRETFYDNYACRHDDPTRTHTDDGIPYLHYRADYPDEGKPDFEGDEYDMRWTSPLFMPRWASRILLEVCSVRVERLNDISNSDAAAEGIDIPPLYADEPIPSVNANRNRFAALWESIHGKGSWAENPWVWVVEFRRIEP